MAEGLAFECTFIATVWGNTSGNEECFGAFRRKWQHKVLFFNAAFYSGNQLLDGVEHSGRTKEAYRKYTSADRAGICFDSCLLECFGRLVRRLSGIGQYLS